MQPKAAGHAWFYEDDYEAFRKLLPDRSWHATFGLWEKSAEQTVQRFESQGIRAIKAEVRSNEFVAWCTASGLGVDAKALTMYANEFAASVLFKDYGN